ncbi:LytR/AlgR family response regulator transcription factor [Xanthovirga aplysinae]|uniref:LytR/AlgR family response regulator transcription factor n=1 Tax=Xanthovirga aplysinae TaxID=2529853 RepID=UPI0012BD072D|nr:LytTR family DNA-binding domain-containing protein [Xanthovirga aplysinae]MTI32101.1 response regulator transcription factor [Xanthovirga aplysinae]
MERKLRCLIVDDEPYARQLLEEYVNKLPFLQLQGSCINAFEAMKVLQGQPVDLLLLDINMPEISGITLLRTLPKPPKVIFTTAFSDYAVEGFELDAVDYLLKPITFDRFLRAINKASTHLESMPLTDTSSSSKVSDQEHIFLREGSRFIKLNLNDILFIEGMKDYASIHTKQGKIVCLQRLKNLEEQLPSFDFIRIHNSYIISMQNVSAVYRHKVDIGDKTISVGETYRQRFLSYLRTHSISFE